MHNLCDTCWANNLIVVLGALGDVREVARMHVRTLVGGSTVASCAFSSVRFRR